MADKFEYQTGNLIRTTNINLDNRSTDHHGYRKPRKKMESRAMRRARIVGDNKYIIATLEEQRNILIEKLANLNRELEELK